MIMSKLRRYWTVRNPVKLEHPNNWDGTVIEPVHLNEHFTPVRYRKLVYKKRGNPKQGIVRAFGDLLKEEL